MWRGYIWYNKINLNLWGCGYLKNGRPDFRDIKSFEEFSRYYWYREELSKICKSLGLEYRSTKQELNRIIEQYFMGNRIEKSQRNGNKNQTEVVTLCTPLLECAFAILICGDYTKAFQYAKDYFAVDGSIAGQNMILAAWSLGIGSVWLGTWPQMDRVFAQSKLFDLPNDQIPHSIIAFGYPLDEIKEKEEYYDESVVHYNKW